MTTQGEFDIQSTDVCHAKVIKCINVSFFFSTQVPPKVNLSELHHPVTEGDNVTLTCNITDGVPKPNQVRWLKDKNPLDEKKTKLVLRDIRKEKEGTYTCEAKNKGGSANDSIKVIVDSKSLKVLLICMNILILLWLERTFY